MKKHFCGILILLAGFVLLACSFLPSQQYANFLADLDLITRFDLCFDAVENKTAGIYMQRELESLKEDAASCPVNDPLVDQINASFTNTANALLTSIRAAKNQTPSTADKALSQAKSYYQTAQEEIARLNAGEQYD